MRHEFSDVLNDLIDYFLLADLQRLKRFQDDHDLPDDLAHAFTHGDSGDRAVLEGVVLPLAGVENLPYRIIFTLDGQSPALLEAGSSLRHRRSGYILQVESGAVLLFTWRLLQHFTNKTLGDVLARYQAPERPMIELENGWYEVQVLAGAVLRDELYEPAFEFVLRKTWSRPAAGDLDVGYRYTLNDELADSAPRR
ncbi:hypothetical protein [Pseudomonas cremoricolorata]|uniref:Uncharacterized protein n=1 Tax=Pseudomonas cremoricolorata TaxID=157783 RepID=A0A089WF51_9PSED|nr:hypothetical protein [Pseudomonas cremoricolorata]AIR87920.1 hypothetical protein LK03_01110 [Pseudomonas cremoricolorata]